MPTIIQSARDRLVREIARRYIRQGYSVRIEPSEEELPGFLKEFQPDMIVTTPEGKQVIEVLNLGHIRPDGYWERLRQAVEGHPGWSVQAVLDRQREEELTGTEMPVLSQEEIEARLATSEQLADQGLLESALIVAWSAAEAALLLMGRKTGLEIPYQGAAPLLTLLLAESNLNRKDYDTLMHILRLRNQAAHGFRTEGLDASVCNQLAEITRRLIRKQRKAA